MSKAPTYEELEKQIKELEQECVEHDRIEEALKEREEHFRLALSAAEMGTWRWDVASDEDTRDAVLNQILGLEAVASTQPNIDFLKRIHPDDIAAAEAELMRSIHENDMCEAEFRIVRPDGTLRWVRDQSRPFYNDKGEYVLCTGVVRDITDIKEAEMAIEEKGNKKLYVVVVSETCFFCGSAKAFQRSFETYATQFAFEDEKLVSFKRIADGE